MSEGASPDNGNGQKVRIDVAVLMARFDEIARRLDRIEDRLDCLDEHDRKITRLEARTDTLAGINGALALFGSIIAGWFGASR